MPVVGTASSSRISSASAASDALRTPRREPSWASRPPHEGSRARGVTPRGVCGPPFHRQTWRRAQPSPREVGFSERPRRHAAPSAPEPVPARRVERDEHAASPSPPQLGRRQLVRLRGSRQRLVPAAEHVEDTDRAGTKPDSHARSPIRRASSSPLFMPLAPRATRPRPTALPPDCCTRGARPGASRAGGRLPAPL